MSCEKIQMLHIYRAICENTAQVQWESCSSIGSHLIHWSSAVFSLPCDPLRGRGWMYLLYPKNSTWRWLRAIPTPRSENIHNILMTLRPLSWACGHGTEMLLILKNLFLTWLLPDIFRYDSPKKCPTVLYAINLWLKPISATGASILPYRTQMNTIRIYYADFLPAPEKMTSYRIQSASEIQVEFCTS